MRLIEPDLSPEAWNAIVAGLPGAHLLQTWEWGQVKACFGWQPLPLIWLGDRNRPVAAALVLQRSIPIRGFSARLRMLYVPKGPLLDWEDARLRGQVLDDLRQIAHRQGAFFCKIDPDVLLGTGVPGQPGAADDPAGLEVVADLQDRGWLSSTEQVQFRNTMVIDLRLSEEDLLRRMKQKGRYNIRLAGRKGVQVRPGGQADLGLLYRMYAETSVRDGFVIRDEAYYRAVWETFLAAGMLQPLIADVEGEAVAAVMVFCFAGKAWYLHGMSRDQHREKMPNYLLQWEAIRRAKAAGCQRYDLWGAPDAFAENDPMWGVYRFKEALGGEVVRHIGAWDLPVNRLYYRLYTQTLPRLLDWMRRRGKRQTQEGLRSTPIQGG